MIAHAAAFVLVILGLVSSNIFMWLDGAMNVSNKDLINTIYVIGLNFVCQVAMVVIFNWIASKATIEISIDEDTEEVEYFSEEGDDDILEEKSPASVQN